MGKWKIDKTRLIIAICIMVFQFLFILSGNGWQFTPESFAVIVVALLALKKEAESD